MESVLLNAAAHRRSPATMPGDHRGRPPRNKGEQYPADPRTVEEIVALMRTVGDHPYGERLRALVVLLWRAGLRISEALALQESDLDRWPRCRARPTRKGRQAPRSGNGPPGLGTDRPVARNPPRASSRRRAVRDLRADCRAALGSIRSALSARRRQSGTVAWTAHADEISCCDRFSALAEQT
jgi:integrase